MSGINTTGAGGGGGPGACASDVAAGTVEIATLLETLAGTTYAGGSACPLAVNPTRLILKEEVATGAKWWDFPTGTYVAVGRGTNAIDLQTRRTAAGQIASGSHATAIGQIVTSSGAGSVAMGYTVTAGAGARAIAIGNSISATLDNAIHVGMLGSTTGVRGIGIGYSTVSSDTDAIALGNTATASAADTLSIGRASAASAADALAIGRTAISSYTDSISIGRGAYDTGVEAIAIGLYATADYRSIAIGYSSYGDGSYCIAIGPGANMSLAGLRSIAIGYNATAGGAGGDSIAIGYATDTNAGNGVGFGHRSFATAYGSIAVGMGVNITTPANLNDATGVFAGDPQAAGTIGINSLAVGGAANAQALRSSAIGFKAVNRVIDTTNIAGATIIRRDSGEPIADAVRVFAGAEDVILTDEIDATAIANHTITLPAGCHFWVTECQLIVTELTGAVTVEPTVQFGNSGDPDKFIIPVITTLLDTLYNREKFTTLLTDVGETSLLFGITVGATVGTSMSVRAAFRGVLIEDE